MENIRKILEVIKTLWSDTRGKALIKLGIYIIFFVFVILYINGLYDNATPVKKVLTTDDIIEQYSKKENYMSKYTIGEKRYTYIKNQKEIVTINGETYYIENGDLINSKDNSLVTNYGEIPFWIFTPNYINDLIKNGEKSYNKSYNDGTEEISYLIPLSELIQTNDYFSHKNNYNGLLDDKNIEIIIMIKDDNIFKTSINLKEYYDYLSNNTTNYLISIEYE